MRGAGHRTSHGATRGSDAPRAWLPSGAALLVVSVALLAGCGSSPVEIATPPSTGFTAAGSAPAVAGTDSTAAGQPGPSSTAGAGGPTTTGAAPSGSGTASLNEQSKISTEGLGAVKFGMAIADAEAAAGTKFDPAGAKASNACFLVQPAAGPGGVQFLVKDGRIERVDVTNASIATRSGAEVGTTVADVKKLYPDQIQDQPRPDGQPGGALVFVPKDAGDVQFRILFLSDGTTVQSYRAGRLAQVMAATGCG